MGSAPRWPLGSRGREWDSIWPRVVLIIRTFSSRLRSIMWPTAETELQISSINYLVDVYQAKGAASGKLDHLSVNIDADSRWDAALAANGCLRFTLGAVFPLFTLPMYEGLGIHWAGSVFGFLSVALLPIPWLLLRYGHRLREKGVGRP